MGLLVEFIYLFIVLAGLCLPCTVQRSVVVAHGFSWPCTCWERSRAGGEGSTEDEMVGSHHRLNGHEFEEAPGDGEGQGNLACCSPRGRKEVDTTEQ